MDTEQDAFEKHVESLAFELWNVDTWESPIEKMMGVALATMATIPEFCPTVFPRSQESFEKIIEKTRHIVDRDNFPFVGIFIQQPIGKYRVDFLVVAATPDSERINKIVVECDGHDFHEKTKEQAERDKKRDRFLTKQDIRVLRFTGREIYRDPFGCAIEALSHMVK